jgi:PPOX class probable F420-dependent enzyme
MEDTMIDFTSEFGQRVRKRLETEQIIWITTVFPDSTPQPNPVWFYWDGESILIYTRPGSIKLKNLTRNPRVSLNFEGATATGGDVVIFHGIAQLEPETPAQHPGYAEKYATIALEEWKVTMQDLFKEYSILIRITLEKVRGF